MRLDKFLSERGLGSRSELKVSIKKGLVKVNNEIVTKNDFKINELKDTIYYKSNLISNSKFHYYMLHKASGCVTANKDNVNPTIFDNITLPNKEELFAIGRLDKDTEGLLILTNDGALSHKLLAPKNHVPKTYQVKLQKEINPIDILQLEQGVLLNDGETTLPSNVLFRSKLEIYLTIYEGKFHQVKRMLQAVNNEVVYLKRIQMGNLILDDTLPIGDVRELTEIELQQLKQEVINNANKY